MSATLRASGVVAGYEPGLPIVRGVDVAAEAGAITALLGPNGAGKSTLIKAICGLVPVHDGSVTLGGRDVTNAAPHRLVRAGLAYVPQTDNVFARLSVADNLDLATVVVPKPERRRRRDAVLALFPDLARKPGLAAGRLSGGQRQMLAIGRALIAEPSVLLLDEPSAGLSPKLVATVFAKIEEVARGGVAVLMVEQNARAALAIAAHALVLVEGRVRHEGAAAGLRDGVDLGALFLGGG